MAAFLTSPLAALSLLTAALVQVPTSRWYLKRAGDGYLWEHASYARLNGVASETVEGAQTMDALGLQAARGRRFQDALAECGDAERYTLGLRLRWFPWLEIGFFLPIATAVLWGGWLAWNGHITIAAATAVTLYVQQLLDPLGELISWLDEIQFAATSLARILGVVRGAARPHRHRRDPTASRSTSTTCATPTGRATTCCTASRSGSCPASGWRSWARRAPASRPSGG